MTPERWQQIEKLFHAALELEPSQRGVFLDQACAGDEELRREVEELLAYESKAEGFIESPALEVAARALAEEPAPALLGQTLSHYQVLSLLGAGGMGQVYLAQDTRLGRKVALKLLPREFTQNANRVRRFEQEARAASALSHPNILTIYDIGQIEQSHFIATEFIEGQTLRAVLGDDRMGLDEVLDVTIQVTNALMAAHEAGIIHRDIKPENIMRRRDGYVKVLDFGLAKLREKPGAETGLPGSTALTTDTGLVMGTASYMSPEQARGEVVNERTDLFSLGVVLYEMATGALPFRGNSAPLVFDSLLNKAPISPRHLNPALPAGLELVIDKALEKEPAARYQTATEMRDDLVKLKRLLESGNSALVGDQAGRGGEEEETGFIASSLSKLSMPARSIAVLPLKPLGMNNPDDYLGMGMADALITRLSNIRQLAVRPTRAVLKYTGLEQDPITVGQELKVDSVLDGTIRQSGDRIRVTVQLVNTYDGAAIWADRFDEEFTHIFAVEDSISQQVTQALMLKLTSDEERRLIKRHTDKKQAYQHYVRGRYHWNKRLPDGFEKAIKEFQQAIDQDPTYALAHAGLAYAYVTLGFWDISPPIKVMPKAKAAAMKALELDEALAEAHVSLGLVSALYDWDGPAAERAFKRAIELSPSNVEARYAYANVYLGPMGLHDQALMEMKQAKELDPVSSLVHAYMGWHLCLARQYDEAVGQAREALEIEPHFLAYLILGRAYEQKAMLEEAIAAFQQAVEISGSSPLTVAALGHTYALSGQRAEAYQMIDQLKGQATQRYVSSERFALIQLGLGENDRAFEWLQEACVERSGWLLFLKVDPMYDSLRSDPRFAHLLQQI